ncbi:MAG TPA: ABC transporter permease, partial [bacterium]|nr:ABC transporter permease [bacterium]
VSVSPVYMTMRDVEHGGKHSQVTLEGVNEDFLALRNMHLGEGRGITRADVLGTSPAAVIGVKIAEDLFQGEDPIGKEIPVGNVRFRVVGLLKKPKLPPGMHAGGGGVLDFEGNTVYIPISTASAYLAGPKPPIFLSLRADDGDFTRVAHDTRNLIARRHRNAPDFDVDNVGEEMLKEKGDVDKMLGNFNVVLGCIAGAALIVGGIGILSLMLIAVNERLFEIGTRKAVGATDGEILVQFLVESATLSGLGAILGTILAVIAVSFLSSKFPMGLAVSKGGLLLAGSFAVGIGVGFGLYPAWLASRMDPVEALRSA